MTPRFYTIWLIGAALIFAVAVMGMALLGQMALTTTGYIPPTPWGMLIAMGLGLALYWSAICWIIALSVQRRWVLAGAVAGATGVIGFGYPAYDAARYDSQRESVSAHVQLGEAPVWRGKTALLLWPRGELCQYACWNLATSMDAQVLVLTGDYVSDIDWSGPVDLTELELWELDPEQNGGQLRAVETSGAEIDFVILHTARSDHFGGAFERFRPGGIKRTGLHIDALIVPVTDAQSFELGGVQTQEQTVLRLVSVSRALASSPFVPMAGPRLYWNSKDRRANLTLAEPYFCDNQPSDKSHWCRNAFD